MSTDAPEVSIDATEEEMEYKWKHLRTDGKKKTKSLDLKIDKCIGCELCKIVCPVDAIEMGPVTEVATGELEGVPLIMIDQDKCIFCGLCAIVCPKDALEFEFDETSIKNLDYPKLIHNTEIDDNKCLPCKLCKIVCPQEAIDLELKGPKKEDLVIYPSEPGEISGSIKIDKDKCSYCGLCEELCHAIKIRWIDPTAEHPVPANDISVELEECDYCGLCQKICPDDAIQVECETQVDREIREPTIEGKIELSEEKCIHCGWCGLVCPTDAIKTTKFLGGTIKVVHLEKCDPVGCKACLNICPSKCWYIPKGIAQKTEEKIRVNEDICIYCGACANSCPEHLIEVKRTETHHTELPDAPWMKAWKEAFNRLIGKLKECVPSRIIEYKKEEEPLTKKPPEKLPEIPEECKKLLEEKIESIENHLRSREGIKTRHLTEKGETEKVVDLVKKKLPVEVDEKTSA